MADESFPSVRGLVDSDIGPLRRFTGILDSAPGEDQVWNPGTPNARTSVRRSINFKDIEVLEAIEPYQFPIYTVLLTESNRKKSRWGVFGTSLTGILDMQYTEAQLDPSSPEHIKPSDRMDLKDCFGKRLGLVMADNEDGRPPKHDLFDGRAKDEEHPTGQDVPTSAWEVYMVEGIGVAGSGGTSPLDEAISVLDGKTIAQFNDAALANELIRSDVSLLTSIGMPVSAPNSFTNTMIAGGQFTKDEQGVFHKV